MPQQIKPATYSRKQQNLYWSALTVIAVIYSLFSYFTPFQYEDLGVIGIYLDYNNDSSDFSWNALLSYCHDMRTTDNGRLANILAAIVIFFIPKWLFAIFTGIVTAGMYAFLTKFVRISVGERLKVSSFGVLSVIWAMSMIALPWRNHIMVADYVLNYIYSSFFNLWAVYCVYKARQTRPGAWKEAAYCFIALVAATFHESFSVVVLSGFGLYALLRRFRLPLSWWLPVIAYLLGTVFVVSSPGIWLRASKEITVDSTYSWLEKSMLVVPMVYVLFTSLAVALAVPSLRKRISNLAKSEIYIVLFTAMTVSFLMCMVLNSSPHYGWFPELLAIALLLPPAVSAIHLSKRGIKVIEAVCMSLFAVTVAIMCNVVRWQHFFNEQDKEIHALIAASPDGTVYYDVYPPEHLTKTVLYQPLRASWIHDLHIDALNHSDRTGRLISVVPTTLRDLRLDENARLADSIKGLYLFKNIIVGCSSFNNESFASARRYNGELRRQGEMTLATEEGNEYEVHVEGFLFVSTEGDTLLYLRHPLVDLEEEIVEAHWAE